MNQDVQESVRTLHDQLRERDLTLVTAESCTGGMLGEAITDVPGSSDVYEGGVVSYSNRLKRKLLGVSGSLLRAHGAVSAPVARAMAKGVRERLQAKVSLSITGIAGPGGGTPEKPVGLVFVGWSLEAKNRVRRREFEGDRRTVRRRSVKTALEQLLDQL